MGSYETNKYYLFVESDNADQAILVAGNVKHYTSGINLALLNLSLISAIFCHLIVCAALCHDNSGCLAEGCFSQNCRNLFFAITLILVLYSEPALGARTKMTPRIADSNFGD